MEMVSDVPKKRSALRRFMPLIIFALLVALLAVGLSLNPRLVPSPLIGKEAPQFKLPLLNSGGTFSDADLKGHITLLNVWASWCFACRQEHENIKYLSREGLRVIGFNYKDDNEDAKNYLRQLGDPYQAVVVDADGRVGIDWGVYGAPETFVIDPRGIIRDKRIGPVDADYIKDELMPLIAKIRGEVS
jgi:cytochrome c biogenesis protein CcmG, thiol:disulfide interchange protein DsbE